MEVYELPANEFKSTVIKLLIELQKINHGKNYINRDKNIIKNHAEILELKIQNKTEKLTRRVQVEEKSSKLKDRSFEMIQLKEQKEKKIMKE